MDLAVGFFALLVFLGVFLFVLALAYRNRATIGKWLNTPYYAESDRKLKLQRRIEDAEKELEAIEKVETETGEK